MGASLALALRARGLALVAFTAHSASGRARAQGWLGGRAFAHPADALAYDPDLYVIAVPDRSVPSVASELGALLAAHPNPDRSAAPVVIHTSGATTVAALSPCDRAGATVLVFHPLQTFANPLTGQYRFEGTAIAVTPSGPDKDSPAAAFGFELAGLLGARPFFLADDRRDLYHVAATFASNYLVTVEHIAERLFRDAGLPSEKTVSLFLPLVKATVENIGYQGTLDALTGPLSRGDSQTIAGHIAALETHAPQLLPVYRAMGLATLDLLRVRGEMDAVTIEGLADSLVPHRENPSEEER